MKTSKPSIYNKTYVLNRALEHVECWNFIDGMQATIESGQTIEVCHPYDAFHTTIQCTNPDGIPVFTKENLPFSGVSWPHPKGGTYTGSNGYRFIVNNEILSEAIGIELPRKTADIVGDIIAYEENHASPSQVKRLFKTLKKTGLGLKLQGHYSSKM
jgi:hypothetical protein